jgi:hypothetical protein
MGVLTPVFTNPRGVPLDISGVLVRAIEWWGEELNDPGF